MTAKAVISILQYYSIFLERFSRIYDLKNDFSAGDILFHVFNKMFVP